MIKDEKQVLPHVSGLVFSGKPGFLMCYLIQFHEEQRVWFTHLNLIFFSI